MPLGPVVLFLDAHVGFRPDATNPAGWRSGRLVFDCIACQKLLASAVCRTVSGAIKNFSEVKRP